MTAPRAISRSGPLVRICRHCHGRGTNVVEACPDCHGTGHAPNEENYFGQCHTCHGEGEVNHDVCSHCC